VRFYTRHEASAHLRHGEDHHDGDDEGNGERLEEALIRAEVELAGIDVDGHEWEHEQEERDLNDRLGQVVDGSCGERLRTGYAHALHESQVHADPTCRARNGQVDELDRRVENDARQQGKRCRHRSPNRDPGADERALGEDQREHHPGDVGLA
jgi:hypothetical protein